MAGKVTSKGIAGAILGLAALGGAFAAGAHDLLSAKFALAGANLSGPVGTCQNVNSFGPETRADRAELVCWTSDFALSIPEPGVR